MSHKKKFSALLIDDEEMARQTFEFSLGDHWDVTCLADLSAIIEQPDLLNDFDVVFLDMVFLENQPLTVKESQTLSPSYGLCALSWIKERSEKKPVFIHSALEQKDYKSDVIKKSQNVFYSPKPTVFDQEFRLQVEAMVKECLQ